MNSLRIKPRWKSEKVLFFEKNVYIFTQKAPFQAEIGMLKAWEFFRSLGTYNLDLYHTALQTVLPFELSRSANSVFSDL